MESIKEIISPNSQEVAIDLPVDVFSSLRLAPKEFVREMRIAAAVQWHAEQRVSQGKAAMIADMPRAAFIDELRRRHVAAIQVDSSELEAEMSLE